MSPVPLARTSPLTPEPSDAPTRAGARTRAQMVSVTAVRRNLRARRVITVSLRSVRGQGASHNGRVPALVLLRHAKSDWDADYGGDDRHRPLSKRGVGAARTMGRLLSSSGNVPTEAI